MGAGASVLLEQVLVSFSSDAVTNAGGTLAATNSTFSNNAVALVASDGASSELGQCSFENNTVAIRATDVTVSASNNWWGDPSGPSGLAPGMGQPIEGTEGAVAYEPVLGEPPDSPR